VTPNLTGREGPERLNERRENTWFDHARGEGRRVMTDRELYKLDCFTCGRTITMPANDGQKPCPRCGAILQVEWNAERLQFARGGEL